MTPYATRDARSIWLRIASCFVVGLLALAAASIGQAAPFQTKAKQAILIDVGANAILFEKNADQRVPPASMSKLMTLAVIFRGLIEGRLKLESEYTMSVNAWRSGGAPSGTSAMMVPVNTKETLEQLLMGIIVQSGNDAAIALAEALAGSETAFARIMNEEAKRIGLTNSTFINSTGLYHPDHVMSARDLAKLAQYLIETYPEYYAWFSERQFKYRRHTFRNRNPLLSAGMGVDGLKTGYLSKAGFGLVASAEQKGRRLILVVNGLGSAAERKAEARRIMEWGFRGFAEFALDAGGEVVGHARVWGGKQFYVPLTGNGPLKVVLPRFPANPKLRAEIVYNGPLKPPVRKGAQIAHLRVRTASGAVNNVPLFAAETVEQGGVIRRGLDAALHLAFGWLP
ncbi:MAG: D-alanyl-D-alanine carboxypeptidase family protein [Pseudomonadota bacterium]